MPTENRNRQNTLQKWQCLAKSLRMCTYEVIANKYASCKINTGKFFRSKVSSSGPHTNCKRKQAMYWRVCKRNEGLCHTVPELLHNANCFFLRNSKLIQSVSFTLPVFPTYFFLGIRISDTNILAGFVCFVQSQLRTFRHRPTVSTFNLIIIPFIVFLVRFSVGVLTSRYLNVSTCPVKIFSITVFDCTDFTDDCNMFTCFSHHNKLPQHYD